VIVTVPAITPVPTRRRLRSVQCGSKVHYLSEMLARNAAMLHAWAGRPGMGAYSCPWCGDWHIGHPRRRNRRGGAGS
jgi:hypothetical protein